MESVLEQNSRKVERTIDWEEVCSKVRWYLRVWRLPETVQQELFPAIMEATRTCALENPEIEPTRFAIEEAERRITENSRELSSKQIPDLSEITRQPQRPLETHPMTMETNLSRMPSFRIVAGWFLLIAALALAYIFSR